MMVVTALCLWLHDLATVIYIGFFLLLVLVYLPTYRSQAAGVGDVLLGKAMKRFKPLAGISLLIFLISGVVLMLVNPDYHGLGQFTNLWSIVMMLKHVVIIGMIVVGMLLQSKTAQAEVSDSEYRPLLVNVDRLLNIQVAMGVLVLFLTAVARIG